eukprot:4664878-Pleurochrysis_carterae.AAC.1
MAPPRRVGRRNTVLQPALHRFFQQLFCRHKHRRRPVAAHLEQADDHSLLALGVCVRPRHVARR